MHQHRGHSHTTGQSVRKIRSAFFINLAFTIIELIGGLLTNSMAILSDALHDLGDSLSLGASWYFQKTAEKQRDSRFTFGYSRFSILGALLNALVLFAGSLLIIAEALPRLANPQEPHAGGMIILAIVGVFFNGFAAWRLRGGENLNQKVVSLHLVEDVLGWLAVLIVAIILLFYDLFWLDPALSVLISLYMLYNVYKALRASLKIILQGTPADVEIKEINKTLLSFKEIDDVHDVHLWTMDGEYNILSFHAVLKRDYSIEEVSRLKQKLKKSMANHNVQHTTVEFETAVENCVGC